jgi:hypothetical protein
MTTTTAPLAHPSAPPPLPVLPAPLTPRRRAQAAGLATALASRSAGLVLLGLVVLSLAAAGFVELHHGARAARELVLDTSWFIGLRVLLLAYVLVVGIRDGLRRRLPVASGVMGVGLLFFLGGDLLTTFLGSDSRMLLADTREPAVHQVSRVSHRGEWMQSIDRHQLEVFRIPSSPTPSDPIFQSIRKILDTDDDVLPDDAELLKDHHVHLDLRPGAFSWQAGEGELLPTALRWLRGGAAIDGPRTLSLGAGRQLTVEDYQPATERWPFRESLTGDFAALRLRLATADSTAPRELWLTSQVGRSLPHAPLALILMELDNPALLREFLHPPSKAELGKQGQLVLAFGRRGPVHRFDLDTLPPGRTVGIAETSLQLTVKQQGELLDLLPGLSDLRPRRPALRGYPSVLFELSGPDGMGEFIACARAPHVPAFVRGTRRDKVAAWLHSPEFRFDGPTNAGAVHFLCAPDRKLWQRTFRPDGTLVDARPVQLGERLELATDARLYCTPVAWLPTADARPTIVPVAREPKAVPAAGEAPALRCRLCVGNQSEQVWVRLGARPVGVHLNAELYFVRFRPRSTRAGFALTLHDAPLQPDSQRVMLTRREGGVNRTSEHTLAPNRPLRFGAFAVTPGAVRPLTRPDDAQGLVDSAGRPVQVLDLTIRRDPGQPFVLAGALVLVCGILTAIAGELRALARRRFRSLWAGGVPA